VANAILIRFIIAAVDGTAEGVNSWSAVKGACS